MPAALRRINLLLDRIPQAPVALLLRLFPAVIFWQSGRTKVEGLSIKPSTWFLFEQEYALPLIPPGWAAVMAVIAEHALPVLLVLGLATRLSALGLLAMTLVIQIFVYPGAWVTHGLWVAALLAVVARGPGRWSVDHILGLEPGARGPE